MDQAMREIHAELSAFRKNVQRMIDAEDRYREYVIASKSIRACRSHPERGRSSVGSDNGPSFGDIDATTEVLRRRMIQAEENVGDIEILLIGMDIRTVQFLEDMYWYKLPAKTLSDEWGMSIPTVYYNRNRILKEMADKRMRNLIKL